MRDLIQQLKERWFAEGIVLPDGVSPERLAAFEHRHGIRLPGDMKLYFSSIDGMGTRDESDSNYYTFWNLDSVQRAMDEFSKWLIKDTLRKGSDFFVFADYSICIAAYCIDVSDNDNEIIALSYAPDINRVDVQHVCIGFRSFLELYLTEDELPW